jgi:hypothetical protein
LFSNPTSFSSLFVNTTQRRTCRRNADIRPRPHVISRSPIRYILPTVVLHTCKYGRRERNRPS